MKIQISPDYVDIILENTEEVRRCRGLGSTKTAQPFRLPLSIETVQLLKCISIDIPIEFPQFAWEKHPMIDVSPSTSLPWQPDLLRDILTHSFWGVFAEMGMGKTWCAIQAMRQWHRESQECRQYVVCTRQFLAGVWLGELQKFAPDLTPVDLTKDSLIDRSNLVRQLRGTSGVVYLVNYEALRKSKNKSILLSEFVQNTYYACFLDESTRVKTLSSQCTKGLQLLRNNCKRRYILTGLPDPESPADFLGQMEFLHPTILGYGSKFQFELQHAIKWGFKIVKWHSLDRVIAKVHTCSTILKKENTNYKWPERRFKQFSIPLEGEQKRLYHEMAQNFIAEIKKDKNCTASIAITKAMRLRQIAGGYITDTEGIIHEIHPNPKLQYLIELLPSVSKPVIIYACFRAEIEGIQTKLNCPALHGGVPQKERNLIELNFMKGKIPILACHPEVGGIGLNLQRSSTIIFYSNDYRNEFRQQAMDRIHRPGQKSDSVLYIDLILQGTIDALILKSLQSKNQLAQILLSTPEEVIR